MVNETDPKDGFPELLLLDVLGDLGCLSELVSPPHRDSFLEVPEEVVDGLSEGLAAAAGWDWRREEGGA